MGEDARRGARASRGKEDGEPGMAARQEEMFIAASFYVWAEFERPGPVGDHAQFTLAGMKRRPNGGGLFKAASRELARVVLDFRGEY